MSEFRISVLNNSSVYSIFRIKDRVYLDAEYQREGDVWTEDKRQLLIDSILNGYDIPKIYLHEFYPAKKIIGHTYDYAVIDGKQRLTTIWGFMDNGFPLADDFVLFRDQSLKLAGLTYEELKERHSEITDDFHGRSLSVVTIITGDIDVIEDMFSRLNEAVPLNAAEKRNAFGGVIPGIIRKLVTHKFFKKRIRVSPKRYRHHDLAAKMLYLIYKKQIVDTKKVYLDAFAKDFPKGAAGHKNGEPLYESAAHTLKDMSNVFVNADDLLRSQGMIVLYFWLFYVAGRQSPPVSISRKRLIEFVEAKEENRRIAEKDMAKAAFALLEFDRLNQAPNDASAIEFRLKVLIEWLKLNIDLKVNRA